MQIVPAILAHTYDELRTKLAAVPVAAKAVHLDVVKTPIPLTPFPKGRESNLPFGEVGEVVFEAHLMIHNPSPCIKECIRAGFKKIIIQVEDFDFAKQAMPGSVELVPSLEIETPLEVIDRFADKLKNIQLMGIAEIGAQGRPFDERVISRVRELREKYPHLKISVDGGVNKKNAEALEEAGADILVVGSAIKEFFPKKETTPPPRGLGTSP
jgi:ribulose-phosphate 3-epimerase